MEVICFGQVSERVSYDLSVMSLSAAVFLVVTAVSKKELWKTGK